MTFATVITTSFITASFIAFIAFAARVYYRASSIKLDELIQNLQQVEARARATLQTQEVE